MLEVDHLPERVNLGKTKNRQKICSEDEIFIQIGPVVTISETNKGNNYTVV